jgi:hypothetical protein
MPRPKKHNTSVYKSGFESKFKDACLTQGWDLPYEADRIKYVIPAKTHTYTPDFTVTKNVYIETKGLWGATDRKKALFIKEQFPDVKILYVLYRDQRLFKSSSTTYLDWAQKVGLKACTFVDSKTWMQFIRDNIYD